MPYRISGIDVHKKMLAVVVSDVEVDGEYRFERRMHCLVTSIIEWPNVKMPARFSTVRETVSPLWFWITTVFPSLVSRDRSWVAVVLIESHPGSLADLRVATATAQAEKRQLGCRTPYQE